MQEDEDEEEENALSELLKSVLEFMSVSANSPPSSRFVP